MDYQFAWFALQHSPDKAFLGQIKMEKWRDSSRVTANPSAVIIIKCSYISRFVASAVVGTWASKGRSLLGKLRWLLDLLLPLVQVQPWRVCRGDMGIRRRRGASRIREKPLPTMNSTSPTIQPHFMGYTPNVSTRCRFGAPVVQSNRLVILSQSNNRPTRQR